MGYITNPCCKSGASSHPTAQLLVPVQHLQHSVVTAPAQISFVSQQHIFWQKQVCISPLLVPKTFQIQLPLGVQG